MTTLNPILLAITNLGGTANIPQISNATAIKRTILQEELPKLTAEGALEHVAGSVYRIAPDKLTAAAIAPTVRSEAKTAAKATTKPKRTGRGPDKRRRKSPVSDKILTALTSLGGSGTVHEVARVTSLTTDQVSDTAYKLKRSGLVTSPRFGSYALVDYVAPVVPAEAVQEAPAPEVPEEVSEAPEATVVDTEALVSTVLDLIAPNGVPVTSKAVKATAKFVAAAERLIEICRD